MDYANSLIMSLILLSVPLQTSAGALIRSSNNLEGRKYPEELPKWIMLLLRECMRQSEIGNAVILSGNCAEEIITEIHRSTKTAIVLFTESKTRLDKAYAAALTRPRNFYEKHLFRYQSKAGIFLLAARSEPSLKNAFQSLKLSIWWNRSGLFFLMNEDVEESGCGNAYPYLWTAWQNGVLAAVYLCRENRVNLFDEDESHRSLRLYSHNPFSNCAPLKSGWKISAVYSGRDGHPWTIFQLDIRPSRDLAGGKGKAIINRDDIFFDKISRNLNGYPVRVNAMQLPPTLLFSSNESTTSSGLEKYSGGDGWLAEAIWGALNATLIDVPYEGTLGMGLTDEEGKHTGMKADFATGRVDIGLNRRFIGTNFNLGTTYPYFRNSYCFVSKSKGFYPLWEGVIQEFDAWIVSLTLVAFLAFNLLLERLDNRSLRFVRLLTYNGMSQPLAKMQAKFLFLGACGLFGMITTLFQGKVSALVTKPRRWADVDTLEELIESDYVVRGYIGYRNHITDPKIHARFIVSDYVIEECFEMSLVDLPVVCAAECSALLMRAARKTGLHIANEPIFIHYSQYIAGINWAIIGEVNAIISLLISAGLHEYWVGKSFVSLVSEKDVNNISFFRTEPRPIQLHDLCVVLYFFLIGLLFAILIFATKVVYYRFKNN